MQSILQSGLAMHLEHSPKDSLNNTLIIHNPDLYKWFTVAHAGTDQSETYHIEKAWPNNCSSQLNKQLF